MATAKQRKRKLKQQKLYQHNAKIRNMTYGKPRRLGPAPALVDYTAVKLTHATKHYFQ
jgi:hypothetical protein